MQKWLRNSFILTGLFLSQQAAAQPEGNGQNDMLPIPWAADGGGPRRAGNTAGNTSTPANARKHCGGYAYKLQNVRGKVIDMDFVDAQLKDFVEFMACALGKNFILTNDLKGEVNLISHEPISVQVAKEVFYSVLETHGYTTVAVGNTTKIVQTSAASKAPTKVLQDSNIPNSDRFVTQIIQLQNVGVNEILDIVKNLSGKSSNIITYPPTNTLIITDAAANIRRVYQIISQMDVGTPKSARRIVPLKHATASDIEKIIKDLYEIESTSNNSNNNSSSSKSKRSKRKKKGKKSKESSSATASAGSEGKYIEKIISDERTNSLIIIANEEAMEAVSKLIAELDVDVDPASRAQIHVVYLEHAKAEDISQVLSNLSEGGNRTNNRNNRTNTNRNNRNNNRNNTRNNRNNNRNNQNDAASSGPSAVAAFDSGVRITSDENTNSLVIIATPDQIRYIKQVIEKLDIRRKQVFVEAVILELASDETSNIGVGAHVGKPGEDDGSLSLLSTQLNGSSIGVSADLLTGMAMGVFGAPVSVDVSDGTGGSTTLSVPAFGIALNALQSNSSVNILSTPNILTTNNEEASIIVGRNIPFP
ncbi:MAG: secretin N-terminal domain-containing protein, partial [Myxococcota bacterium]|nr:secretin N-terminal domain-containing protein [Myxococcota bacterium]